MNKAYAKKRDDYGRPPSLHEISLSFGDIVRSHSGEIRERRRDRKARERNGQLATTFDRSLIQPGPGNRRKSHIGKY